MNGKSLTNKKGHSYLLPLVLITSLFFLWGFSRSVLDVLNKHFQDRLHVSLAESMLVQGSTYAAYALMAIPAGMIITRWGFKRGLVIGLAVFAAGCLLFIPGSISQTFGIYLAALFVIGCGLASLETAANPYVAELGDPRTAASRLNLSQAFNGLGSMLGPVAIGGFLFSDSGSSVAVPYTVMGVAVGLLAVVFAKLKLPEITVGKQDAKGGNISFILSAKRLWENKAFVAGLATLFCYEIAEIGINSIFINYVTDGNWLGKVEATWVLSFGALGLFMLSRLAGSWIMRRVKAVNLLAISSLIASGGAVAVCIASPEAAHYALFACYAGEAIVFPTVFAMTVEKSGLDAKAASSFMMMTPLGGAVGAWLMGRLAADSGFQHSFWVPAAAYGAVVCYSIIMRFRHDRN